VPTAGHLPPGIDRVLVVGDWNGNRESLAMWRRRTEAELTGAAARGVVVVRLLGARAAGRWLATQPGTV
jgi:hypothetical protein